jgi:hypothetical protein
MKKIIYFITFFLCINNLFASKEDTLKYEEIYLISIHPLSIGTNGIKLEIEKRDTLSRFSFGLSPEFYFGEIENARDNIFVEANKDNINSLGGGISFTAKYYARNSIKIFKSTSYPFNFYSFASIDLRYFDLDYTSKAWLNYEDNGTKYYKLGNVEQNNKIFGIGLNLGIGSLFLLSESLFVDVFLGFKMNKPFQSLKYSENEPLEDNFYTYSGNSFLFSFKFGLIY